MFVTDLDYSLEAIGQLYRDRADAENAFDELKPHQPITNRAVLQE